MIRFLISRPQLTTTIRIGEKGVIQVKGFLLIRKTTIFAKTALRKKHLINKSFCLAVSPTIKPMIIFNSR